jgi:adenylate cyclase
MLGLTRLLQGDFTTSRAHLEEALKIYDPQWDVDDKFRLSLEPGFAAMAYLAVAQWIVGEVERARDRIDESVTRSTESAHVPTIANSYNVLLWYETFRGDASAVLNAANIAVEHSQGHALGFYLPMARVHLGWARARLGEPEPGITLEMRQALAAHTEHGNKAWAPLFIGLLAETEAALEGADVASARLGEALALAAETGEHWTDAFLHRIRGEILLKHDPAHTAPAEEAFLTAIAIARQQKARRRCANGRVWHSPGGVRC